MFKARVITGATMIFGMLCLAYFASNIAALVVFTVILFLSALEWGAVSGLKSFQERLLFSTIVVGISLLVVYAPSFINGISTANILGTVFTLIWIAIACWVVSYQKTGAPVLRNGFGLCCLGVAVLVPFFVSIIFVWNKDPIHFLALILVVSSVDSFAYFGGKKWGRLKFVKKVSPAKTWVGVFAGVFGALLVGNIIYFISDDIFSTKLLFIWNLILIATILAAILGDLLESLVKRFGNIKSSGVVLPGHGGLLDRIDSLCAAAPMFFLFNYIFFGP